MSIKQNAGVRLPDSIKNGCATLLLLLFIGLGCPSSSLYGVNRTEPETITYYLYIAAFAENFITIPTSSVSSGIISSKYFAGKAPIYDMNNRKAGTCSASFLCMQSQDQEGIFTDISNYLSADNGLIVTWFTPTTPINLALDSLINSMVTECTVIATTKVGVSPLFGQTFNLIVSSDGERIYFKFTRIETIF